MTLATSEMALNTRARDEAKTAIEPRLRAEAAEALAGELAAALTAIIGSWHKDEADLARCSGTRCAAARTALDRYHSRRYHS